MNLPFALEAVEPDNAALLKRIDAVAALRRSWTGSPTPLGSGRRAGRKGDQSFPARTQPAVIAAALAHLAANDPAAAPREACSAIDVFAALRRWRNVF